MLAMLDMLDMTTFAEREACIPRGRVRTRFAPSPTGYMHVGGLRTALYAYLIAKRAGGDFLLRIEDTDQERLVQGAQEVIFRTLREAGLTYDEGPDVGGPVGPYIQTERRALYGAYATLLVQRGGAYPCFCGKEEHTREEGADGSFRGYDGRCSHLTPEEVRAKQEAGLPYVIRQRMPREGTTSFDDVVFGRISVENKILEDNILIKSDGLPTYNFANVVDDHLMGITHVVRGTEYLSSTPRYNLLYESFGWEKPVYIHVSPVMRDAAHKLSKRHGDPTYEDLLAMGLLPEAVLSYVALLGWSPGGEKEMFTLRELTESFTIEGLSKSPAIFDMDKLVWLNGQFLRALPPDEYARRARPYLDAAVRAPFADRTLLASLTQARADTLADIPAMLDFVDRLADYDTALYVHKKSKTSKENALTALRAALPALTALPVWDQTAVHDALIALVAELGVKTGQVLWPVRVALSGKASTPGGGVELCALLGREESLARLRHGIETLTRVLAARADTETAPDGDCAKT
jgi:glutamyl-tRNA synthetase